MILNAGFLSLLFSCCRERTGFLLKRKHLTRMRVSYSSIGAASLATWVGTDAGIFNKHGLDVGLIYIGGGPRAMATTIANETQITQGAGTGSILAKLGGADTVMVATILNTTPQSLMVIPEIRAPQDLRGKKLGVTRFGALSDFGVRKYLQKVGLDPEKDVTILQLGGLPEILAAIQSGAIHGGALSSPALTKAKQLGYKEMMDLGALGISYPGTSYMTTETFIKNHRPQSSSFSRALSRARIISAATKKSPSACSRNIPRSTSRRCWRKPINYSPSAIFASCRLRRTEEVKTVLDQIKDKDPRARTTDYDSFIRGDLMREIEQSGFIKNLSRG